MVPRHAAVSVRHIMQVVAMLLLCTNRHHAQAGGNDESELRPQCAQKCVQHVCALKGIPVTLDQITAVMPAKRTGESMLEMQRALAAAGLDSAGCRMTYDALCSASLPVIAHMQTDIVHPGTINSHWVVVVNALESGRVRVFDGDGQYGVMSNEKFREEWTGNVLTIAEPRVPRRPSFIHCLDKGGAYAKFESTYVYAGEIPQDTQSYDFAYAVSNAGTEPLVIRDIKTNCGCTVLMGNRSMTVPPGGTADIVLRYHMNDSRGRFQQSAVVLSNDAYTPLVELIMAGNGRRDVKLSDTKVDFGAVVQSEKVSRVVYAIPKGDDVFRIRMIESPDWCSVVGRPLTEDLVKRMTRSPDVAMVDADVYVIVVEVDTSTMNLGTTRGSLRIHTDLPQAPIVSIPVMVTVTSNVVVYPQTFFVGDVEDNEMFRQSVTIVAPAGGEVEVCRVDTKKTGLESHWVGDRGTARVVVEGKRVREKLKGEEIDVVIRVGQETSTVTIPISGIH